MNNIRYINSVPGYPARHSPYSHDVPGVLVSIEVIALAADG
jgi:hypothetical protein